LHVKKEKGGKKERGIKKGSKRGKGNKKGNKRGKGNKNGKGIKEKREGRCSQLCVVARNSVISIL
jgi:hypothetical protein